ncbi:hypothetical protein B0H13DRAFT_2051177 [Mycena leptocephala]|nr:hypothetical protein B0H13DRAFT_2051177 [Mycena leptocephala]
MPEKTPARSESPKRRRCSDCDLILVVLAVVALFVIDKSWVSLRRRYLKARPFYDYPRREFFANETDINCVANRSDVVQPLIGLDDKFDIAVTIWQLATQDEAFEEYLRQRQKTEGKYLFEVERKFLAGVTPEEAEIHHAYVKWYDRASLVEKTIFSDIVFRGVRLSDTDLHADLSFKIPTQIFHEHPGTNSDLRASFVILPRSSSPLDHFKNYTSWFPTSSQRRVRFKSLPFPHNSPTEFYYRPADKALDAVAITIPLLERRSVPSLCPAGEYNGDTDDEILTNHPHNVTRTHLRVMRESRLFRRQEYVDRHNWLRNNSCSPIRELCRKSYLRGNWEVMMQFAVPDAEAEGGFRNEFAYGPYMDELRDVAEPKDIVPVPINREFCDVDAPTCIAPRRFSPSDLELTPGLRSHYTETYGLHDHRHHPDPHPRPRFVRLILSVSSFLFVVLLNCTYWARMNTTYLSVPGTLCIVAGDLLSFGGALQTGLMTKPLSGTTKAERAITLALSLGLRQLPEPLFMLKAISRTEVVRTGVMLRLRRVPATPQERASARLDARTDWRLKFGVFAMLLLAHHTFDVRTLFIVEPTQPKPKYTDDVSSTVSKNVSAVAAALMMTGGIMQLILNHRTWVFAGRYKVAVEALSQAASATWLVGRSEVTAGISYGDVLWLISGRRGDIGIG